LSTEDAPLAHAPAVTGPPPRLLIVRAPYYRDIVEGMTKGAQGILSEAGATHDLVDVAGAFELPQAIAIACEGRVKYDGFVALGCVVKGETDHYEFICAATMQGLMKIAIDRGIALGSGVLTVDNIAQAEARSGHDRHNKGAEAAVAALRQIDLARRLDAV